MDINGIWKVEMMGIYGWEPTATAFLENGRYLSGSNNHCAVGKYTLDGKDIYIDGVMNVYKNTRALFGKKSSSYDVSFRGTLKGNVIEGEAKEGKRNILRYKATKIEELP
jgi:hypothetical protein